MTTFFSSEFFARNRANLQNTVSKNVPVIVTANGSMQRGADEPFKFVQDSNFWYLTGLNTAELVLVMDGRKTYLIAPILSVEREVFDGALDLEALKARSGIDEIVDERTGWQMIKELLEKHQTIATFGTRPAYSVRYRMHIAPYRRRLIAKLKRLEPGLQVQDIRPEIAAMRCIKQPEELQALQRAIDITIETLQNVTQPDVLQPITQEYELEAAISYGFRSRGADGHAFEPIVGAGAHGTTLHHVNNDGPVGDNDMIVLDVGASVELYDADITRTVCKQPLSTRQTDVLAAVIRVQDYALGLLKPGAMMKEYEASVVAFMGRQLQDLGLIATVTDEAVRHYFPHSTSHFLGLDTHDVGDYRKPLEPGMVLTCEPGIYIPEENIGVRIEDDVLITADGNKVLSAACPRTPGHVQ
jgi:Xaa-Pro aminopeptidase